MAASTSGPADPNSHLSSPVRLGNGGDRQRGGDVGLPNERDVQYWLEHTHIPTSPRFQERCALQDTLGTAAAALREGAVIAIKGAWGFDLVCDATQRLAVNQLRQGKQNKTPCRTPFAVMVRDLAMAEQWAVVGDREAAALTQPGFPIVLLRSRRSPKCQHFANLVTHHHPGSGQGVGIMLAPSPLHRQLMDHLEVPLAITSGNPAGDSPCVDNHQARRQLGAIADYFLMSNQRVSHGVEASVVQVVTLPASSPSPKQNSQEHNSQAQNPESHLQVIRRSRGYTTQIIDLPAGFDAAPPILAMGPTFNNTIALVRGRHGILSQHLGNLDTAAALRTYQTALDYHQQLWNFDPKVVAVDSHPDYHPTQMGREWQQDQRPIVTIQHHHSHVAACLVDNQVPLDTKPVLALVLDDFGYGCDDTLWGGELLWGNYSHMDRLGCFKPVPHLSGFATKRYPWTLSLTKTLAQKRPLTSSCGWLFGEVASMLDLPQGSDSDGRLILEDLAREVLTDTVLEAMGIQAIAHPPYFSGADFPGVDGAYPFPIAAIASQNHPAPSSPNPNWLGGTLPFLQLDPSPMWSALMMDVHQKCAPSLIAAKVHRGLAMGLAQWVARARSPEFSSPLTQVPNTLDTIVLTGSVFQNRLLLQLLIPQLRQQGLRVLIHRDVPMGDGGVALGQVAIAAAQSLGRSQTTA